MHIHSRSAVRRHSHSGSAASSPPPPQSEEVRHQVLHPYGVGIDTHSKFIQVCILWQKGSDINRAENEFPTAWLSLVEAHKWACDFLKSRKLLPAPDALRYCIESTGTYHLPVLKAWRGVPSVVNPLLAGPTRRKTDVLDARLLAHHSITGMWRASFIPSQQAQELRVLWAQRREWQRNATRCSNRINNLILRFGHTFGADYPMRSPQGRTILEDLLAGKQPRVKNVAPDGLPESIRPVIQRLLSDMIEFIAAQRVAEKNAIEFISQRLWPTGDAEISGETLMAHLQTVPGVGKTTALTWLVEVCDPRRFQHAKQVGAFAGCDPSLKVSAGKVTSHTRRAGNTRLHQALLYAASGLMRRPEDKLAQWGMSIAGRHKKGGHRKACGAIARRLACSLWYVHSKGEDFSYEKYTFGKDFQVPETSLVSVLPQRARALLQSAGLGSKQAVVAAYQQGKLGAIQGFGAQSIEAVKQWVVKGQSTGKKRVMDLDPSKKFSRKVAHKIVHVGEADFAALSAPLPKKGSQCAKQQNPEI